MKDRLTPTEEQISTHVEELRRLPNKGRYLADVLYGYIGSTADQGFLGINEAAEIIAWWRIWNESDGEH